MLAIIILVSSLIIAGMLHRIANAFEDQNDIQKEHIKLTKSLLEKKKTVDLEIVKKVNDQITDAVTQTKKATKTTKTK
jgi:archaellum component FlaF (FlaF/FlaG flagellin family)